MTTLFDLEQYTTPKVVHDPYRDEIVLDCSGKEDCPVLLFPEQENSVLEDERISVSELPEQLPEHRKTQWVEEYSVNRSGTKHWYYRYCYYTNRKIYHIHIPGGNYQSAVAIERKRMIEKAIALGKTHWEIESFIRGGFGLNGNKMIFELRT